MPRMTETNAITADTLNDVMEFNSVIRVNSDLTVTTGFGSVYAPDLYDYLGSDGISDYDLYMNALTQGWSLLEGFTGQYGYNGPLMSTSEYIGGGLADHILASPGLYVVVAVELLDEEGNFSGEAAGWVIAYRENA